jgi:hypothetical protein
MSHLSGAQAHTVKQPSWQSFGHVFLFSCGLLVGGCVAEVEEDTEEDTVLISRSTTRIHARPSYTFYQIIRKHKLAKNKRSAWNYFLFLYDNWRFFEVSKASNSLYYINKTNKTLYILFYFTTKCKRSSV